MMENKIKEILQPGETVKWSGRPQNVKLMEAPYGVSFILRVVCAVLLVAVALWFNGPGAGVNMEPTQGMVFLVACVVIALYLVLDPIYVMNKMKKGTYYYITDQRVITCYGDDKKVKKIKMRTLDELDEVSVDQLSNGNSLIYLGKKTKRAPRTVRTRFAFTDVQDKEEEIPLMFYSVDNAKDALSCLPVGLCR